MTSRPGPATRIQTRRLLIRCWEPGERDARLLRRAIEESLEHLRAWMPWARAEPESVEAKIERMEGYADEFRRRGDYVYGIFPPDESAVLGGCGLHARVGTGARELGYWIHVQHLRRGYATEMGAALSRVGFEVEGLERLEIRCDPRNGPSAGVPRKLDYVSREVLPDDTTDPDGKPRDTMVWELRAGDYGASAAASHPVQAFDARGRSLALAPVPRAAKTG